MRRALRSGVRRLFRLRPSDGAAIRAEADEELDALIAARIEHLIDRGMDPEAAHREALRRVGESVEGARQQIHGSATHRERRMRMSEWMTDLAQDVRYAARGLLRRPGFTVVAVLTLAIGIGATTAIFSAIDAMILRPLPYDSPDQLMRLSLVVPARGAAPINDQLSWSYPKFVAYRAAARSFASMALYTGGPTTITSDEPEATTGEEVGATYLRTLGLVPAVGRDLDVALDAHPGALHQALISHALWLRRYNADSSVIGRPIGIDREPYTIVGVAPEGFKGLTGQAELFVPVMVRPADDFTGPQSHEFQLIARRRPSVPLAAAQAETEVLGRRVNDLFAGGAADLAGWAAVAKPLDAVRVAPAVRRSLYVLFAAVWCVLLIACVNVANLMLGRASIRRSEMAVRVAIGAGRGRIVRLLLTESLLLSMTGAVASIGVAWIGIHALAAVDPGVALHSRRLGGLGAVALSGIRLDWAALAFTLLLAVINGLAFGALPAMLATGSGLAPALKAGASDGGNRQDARGSLMRRTLVVAEVALAVVLLAGSGLMVRSLANLLSIDPGFSAPNVLTMRLTIPPGGVSRDSTPPFYRTLLARLGGVPGVTTVALANCPPLNGGCNSTDVTRLDRAPVDGERARNIGITWVTPTWFSAMGIPLLRGRMMTDADRVGAPSVALISESAARQYFAGEDPIGKHIRLGVRDYAAGAEIIGIVGDVRQSIDSLPLPTSYVSFLQSPRAGMMLFARTARDPLSFVSALRLAVRDVAPALPLYDIKTMTARSASATAPTRFTAILLGLFASTALLLGGIGIYGVMSLTVAARTREIGIRIALGAGRRRVRRLVMGEALTLAWVGVVLGLAGALAATRVLTATLYGVTTSDPVTYVGIVGVVLLAALGASWLPARRAAQVDPIKALRAE